MTSTPSSKEALRKAVAQLKELDAKRTKGPWSAWYDNEAGEGWDWFIALAGRENIDDLCEADAEFIVALENALPLLLSAAEKVCAEKAGAGEGYAGLPEYLQPSSVAATPRHVPRDVVEALRQIDTIAVCTGVVDHAQHRKMLENIARLARQALTASEAVPAPQQEPSK